MRYRIKVIFIGYLFHIKLKFFILKINFNIWRLLVSALVDLKGDVYSWNQKKHLKYVINRCLLHCCLMWKKYYTLLWVIYAKCFVLNINIKSDFGYTALYVSNINVFEYWRLVIIKHFCFYPLIKYVSGIGLIIIANYVFKQWHNACDHLY